MTDVVRTCDRAGCGNEYVPRAYNQRYCCEECTRLATNKNIMDKYYERRAIKLGHVRHCKSCGTKLSRYNPDAICGACQMAKVEDAKNTLLTMFNEIEWVD